MPFSNKRETYIYLVTYWILLKQYQRNNLNFSKLFFAGVSEPWHAFATFRFKISFSIPFLETAFKEDNVFADLSRIALMLGWVLYFITRFANGSSELTLFTENFPHFGIFNLETILEKKWFFIAA